MLRFVVLALLLSTPSALAKDDTVLRGLNTVRLVVESLDADAHACGLNQEQLTAEVERRLRDLGVPIAYESEPPRMPYVYVYVNVVRIEPVHLYSYSFFVRLNECVMLRDGRTICGATTWDKGGLGVVDAATCAAGVRAHVFPKIDLFAKAYLAMNPKQRSGPPPAK